MLQELSGDEHPKDKVDDNIQINANNVLIEHVEGCRAYTYARRNTIQRQGKEPEQRIIAG